MRKLSDVKRELTSSRETINKRFDQLETVVNTLCKFNVTDDELKSPTEKGEFFTKPHKGLAASLEQYGECLGEAIDLCNILNSMEQPKKWRLFKRMPTDETVMSILQRIKFLFLSATMG